MTDMFVFVGNEKLDWASINGYNFIMPAVSVGNVGQLAVDLLINSLPPVVKLARVNHPVFVPVVGSDPYDDQNPDLMTAAELYINKEKKLVFLQIRSLLIKAHCVDFLAQLVAWIKECSFANTILLSSCYSYERVDSQLTGSPFRYTVTSAVQSSIENEFKKMQWIALEKKTCPWKSEEKELLFYPGGGFTEYFNTLCGNLNIPLTTLLIFCAEGDNIPGVLLLSNHLNEWLKVVAPSKETGSLSWRFPVSWKHFFGNPAPMTMY